MDIPKIWIKYESTKIILDLKKFHLWQSRKLLFYYQHNLTYVLPVTSVDPNNLLEI